MVKSKSEERLPLNGVRRAAVGTASTKSLRRQGLVPGVVYGKKTAAVPVAVNGRELVHILHTEAGEHALLTLRIAEDGGKPSAKPWERPVLVKAVQHHPVDGRVVHVDFHAIVLTEKIHVKIPIELRGEPIGVKEQGGVLEHFLREVEVECLPTAIPKHIECEISAMNIGDTLHVRDLPPPPEATIIMDLEGVVASVQAPKEEKAEEEAEVAEPEVITEKKEEGEPGEGETAKAEPAEGKKEPKKEKKKEPEKPGKKDS